MPQDVDVLARPHLLLVSDPMCSWCYAFAPVSQQLAAHYAQRLTMRLVTPGMRNNPEPMPAEKRQGLLQMLHKVRDASGRPFAGLQRLADSPLAFDSQPACRLLLAARETQGDAFAMDLMDALHHAFYEEGVMIGDQDGVAQATEAWLRGRDVPPQQLYDTAAHASTEAALRLEMDFARQLGIEGFPTTLGWDGQRYYRLFAGYQPLDVAKLVVDRFIERALTPTPDAEVH